MCDDITLLSITEICTTTTDDDDENDGLMTYEAAQLMRSLKINNYAQRSEDRNLMKLELWSERTEVKRNREKKRRQLIIRTKSCNVYFIQAHYLLNTAQRIH